MMILVVVVAEENALGSPAQHAEEEMQFFLYLCSSSGHAAWLVYLVMHSDSGVY